MATADAPRRCFVVAAGADQNGPQAGLQQIRILRRPDSPLYSLPVEALTNHHKRMGKNNTSVLLPDSFWRLQRIVPLPLAVGHPHPLAHGPFLKLLCLP